MPPAKEELGLEAIKKQIVWQREQGLNDLMISGGEPTLHKDLIEIVKFALDQGYPEISIQTNGSTLSRKGFLQSLMPYRSRIKFNVSFHSHEPDAYSRLSHTPANLEKTIEGIGMLCDLDFLAFFTIVINGLNYQTLKEHLMFLHGRFPKITHYSFNYIDPVNKARENLWVVPRYSQSQRYIHEAVRYMKEKSISFRIDMLPLCYMTGFEEYCTGLRRTFFDEKRIITHLSAKGDAPTEPEVQKKPRYPHVEQCRHCTLRDLCPGINPNYLSLLGKDDIYPVFDDPKDIVRRIDLVTRTIRR